MTTTDDKTERVDIPADVSLEVDFSPSEALTPVPKRTPAMCWKCEVTATFLNAAAPAPKCEREARENFETCSVANDLSYAVCAAKLIVRLGAFEWYYGPERRVAVRVLPPLGLPERRGAQPPPIPPRKDGE